MTECSSYQIRSSGLQFHIPGFPLVLLVPVYILYYSLLPNFVEWFLANILVTRCRSHMGFSALDSESKLQSCVRVRPVVLELFAINHSTKLGNELQILCLIRKTIYGCSRLSHPSYHVVRTYPVSQVISANDISKISHGSLPGQIVVDSID